jgi:hypothetical protein
MRNKIMLILSAIGIAMALYSALHLQPAAPGQPPVFNPAANPYADGIYANGIVESLTDRRREHQHLPGSLRADHQDPRGRRRRRFARERRF